MLSHYYLPFYHVFENEKPYINVHSVVKLQRCVLRAGVVTLAVILERTRTNLLVEIHEGFNAFCEVIWTTT